MAVRKTALLLDEDLVAQVRELLGTGTTTETIGEALREVIRVRGRARHLERLHRRRGLDLGEGRPGGGRQAGGDDGDAPR
jgi:Arc/MetJ family transcription regulator